MLQHLLAEGQKGLTPESVSCRTEANPTLEHGLWAPDRDRKRLERGQREQCVWGRSLRTGEERRPERQGAPTPSDGGALLILSSLQEFLYKTAGGLIYWIGLTKAGSEGDWYWVDDTLFDKVQSMR